MHARRSAQMEQRAPGKALPMSILAMPNPARGNGPEWRASEVVKHAAAAFGVTFTHNSANSTLRLRLTPKGWVQLRKAGKGSTLFSLTAEVLRRQSVRAASFPLR